ncbi:MAG: pyruvate kinase, partial [Planctomycetota bacterium]
MGDLCGPKIRLGDVKDEPYMLNEGDEIILTTGTPDLPNAFDTNYPAIINDVQQGQRILID